MNPSNLSQSPSGGSDPSIPGGVSSDTTSGKIADAKRKIGEAARETATQVKNTAASAVSRVKEQASEMATERREQAAERIGGYSSAAHDAARSLEEQDPNIAWFTHRAADRLQGVADYVRTRDFTALRSDCEGLARRHPAAFFGGMFIAGLVLGNLLKATRSSGQASWNDEADRGGDTGATGASGNEGQVPLSGEPIREPSSIQTSAAGI